MKKFKIFTFIFAFITLCIGALSIALLPNTQIVSEASNIKDDNIVFESFDKTINISNTKVCDIVETISMRFKESGINVGYTRNISHTNKITRIVNGKRYATTTKNKFKLISVTVDGHDEYHFTDSDSEYFYIMTGEDNDFKEAGTYEYKFHYTLDMGEDFINDFDDFTFDLLDYDFYSPVMKFSASVTLPESFYANGEELSRKITFRTNKMQTLGWEAVHAEVVGNTISCHYDKPLRAQTGFTIQVLLPNRYFNTSYTPSSFYYAILIIAIISCIGVFAMFLYGLISRYAKHGIIITPEFYPPKGFSPLDVARTYRGYVKSEDFATLILDWAAKGLVKIDLRTKKNVVLTKLAEYPELSKSDENYATRRYEKEYFDALFKKGKTFSTLDSKFERSSSISSAVTKIYDYDDDTKKPTKIARAIGHILAMLPWLFYIIWYGISVSSAGFVMLFITIFITIGTFVFLYVTMPILFKLIWCGGFTGIPIAMLCIMGFQSIYDINNYAILAFVLLFVLHTITRFISIRSKKYNARRGEVLGFKNFLKKVELQELEMLIAENPEYYYDILPYCYIFGLTKKMEEKFNALHIPPPTYCSTGMSTTIFCHTFAHSMMHSASHRSSSSGGFSGGGFGGGGSGGSSGGGGGGGGGHGR